MGRFKFNVLDITIIIIVIVAVAVGGFLFLKYNKSETLSGEKKTIQFTVEVADINKEVAESFLSGGPVVYGTANSDTGKVIDVNAKPYKKIMKDTENGKFVMSTYADRYQADVTIEAQVSETETSFKGSTEEIQVGAKMPFKGKGFAASIGYIIDVKEK